MLEDGLYKVEFGTPLGRGVAVVVLREGRVEGGDAGYTYAGAFAINGEDLSSELRVKQHTAGMSNIFGPLVEFDLSLRGPANATSATVEGSSRAVPGVSIKIHLTKLDP